MNKLTCRCLWSTRLTNAVKSCNYYNIVRSAVNDREVVRNDNMWRAERCVWDCVFLVLSRRWHGVRTADTFRAPNSAIVTTTFTLNSSLTTFSLPTRLRSRVVAPTTSTLTHTPSSSTSRVPHLYVRFTLQSSCGLQTCEARSDTRCLWNYLYILFSCPSACRATVIVGFWCYINYLPYLFTDRLTDLLFSKANWQHELDNIICEL